jgi:hypothetical protein
MKYLRIYSYILTCLFRFSVHMFLLNERQSFASEAADNLSSRNFTRYCPNSVNIKYLCAIPFTECRSLKAPRCYLFDRNMGIINPTLQTLCCSRSSYIPTPYRAWLFVVRMNNEKPRVFTAAMKHASSCPLPLCS